MPRRVRPLSGIGAAAAIFAAVVLAAGLAPHPLAAAATGGDGLIGGGAGEVVPSSDLVRRIQQALTKMGFYSGVVDGRMNEALRAAIETYQRASGRTTDGKVSPGLAEHMDTQDKVGSMLKRLQTVAEEKISAAREALAANEETRHLLKPDDATEVADPTRDASECFAEPSERCLLDEALESAKAIFKPELRDWAYGEILVAQAKADMIDEAIATVRRIGDARLIMVALRDISRAQAQAGRLGDARDLAQIIPDLGKRLEALAAVAEILLVKGINDRARSTARTIMDAAATLDDLLKRVGLHSQMAVVLARAGESRTAVEALDEIQAIIRAAKRDGAIGASDYGAAMRHVASAFAGMGDPERALTLLDDISGDFDRVAVLMSSAKAQAVTGRTDEALATAGRIETERYKAVMLGRIAAEMARKGEQEKAFALVAHALRSTDKIDLPYARAYAAGQIALSLVDIGSRYGEGAFSRAVEAAGNIENEHLRAYTLWSVANGQARMGLQADAEATVALAKHATDKMTSSLSRVWMLADIASERLAEGERDGAQEAFDRGLVIAESITNPWGRARALARLAVTLHDFR